MASDLRQIRRWQMSDDPRKQALASEAIQHLTLKDRERYLEVCEQFKTYPPRH